MVDRVNELSNASRVAWEENGRSGYKNLVRIETASLELEDAYRMARENNYDYFVRIVDENHVFGKSEISIYNIRDYPDSLPPLGGRIEYGARVGEDIKIFLAYLHLPIPSTLFFKGGDTEGLLKRMGLEHPQYGSEFAKLYQL